MLIGSETVLRAAWNPHIQQGAEDAYRAFAASTEYYLKHKPCKPGIPENICLTRILANVFDSKVVDGFGWEALTQAFSDIQDDYPWRACARDHTWAGFLEYLSTVVDLDLHSAFGDYGLPVIEWTGDSGFEADDLSALSEANQYRFRARILDREGSQPTDAKPHIYGDKIWQIAMTPCSYSSRAISFDLSGVPRQLTPEPRLRHY